MNGRDFKIFKSECERRVNAIHIILKIKATKTNTMELESPIQGINKSANEVFEFLSNMENFEKLMPENISKFEVSGDNNGFIFALSGMPEIEVQKKQTDAPNTIVLGSAGGKLDFNLTALIQEISDNSSEAQFVFTGQFNSMIGMMIKGPINKFIETLATNIPKAI